MTLLCSTHFCNSMQSLIQHSCHRSLGAWIEPHHILLAKTLFWACSDASDVLWDFEWGFITSRAEQSRAQSQFHFGLVLFHPVKRPSSLLERHRRNCRKFDNNTKNYFLRREVNENVKTVLSQKQKTANYWNTLLLTFVFFWPNMLQESTI